MAEYRLISSDLRTGTRITELALSGLTYSQQLNGAGSAGGTLFLPTLGDPQAAGNVATRAQISVLNDAVDEARRQLLIERDGVPVWAGVVWASPYDDATQTRKVMAGELWSYYRHRVIDALQTFSAVDQFTIVSTLLTDAHSRGGGDIGVTVPVTTSGRTRDRTYEAFEYKNLGEAIEELSAVIDGFDFAIDLAYNGSGDLVKTLNMEYPRRGRNVYATGHVFELGRNIVEFVWPSDGTRTANKIFAVGAGEGRAAIVAVVSDTSQLTAVASGGAGYPLLEQVIRYKDISVVANLMGHAQQWLTQVSRPVTLPELTVRADLDPVFGSYVCGDSARVVIPPNMTPRFPDGLDTFRRIVAFGVSVTDEGAETIKLTLGEEPA